MCGQKPPNPSEGAAYRTSVMNARILFSDKFYTANVFITPGGIFGSAGEKYIRVSLCATEEKINEAINRIKKNFYE